MVLRKVALGCCVFLAGGCDSLGALGGGKSGVNDADANGEMNNGLDGDGDGAPVDPAVAATDPTICVPGVPVTSQIPLLTNRQYDRTIFDLLGVGDSPSTALAPNTVGSIDSRAWDGYKASAARLAAQVLADTALRAGVIPCDPAADEAGCAHQFIEEFGRRAFRRPLTEAEIMRFLALYNDRATITANGTFDEAAEQIIRAFLMSPSFLVRGELEEQPDGVGFSLSGFEVASRLSYMLWGTMPDDALLSAAAAGTLDTPTGILTEATRMLADSKAREMVGEFHREWLGMDHGTRWTEVQRDTTAYPLFSDAFVPAMNRETELFVDHVAFSQGTFQDLMTSPTAFVNATLAPIYGLDAAAHGPEFTQVELAATERGGVLSRVGFLTSHSLFNRTSPILRGAFIQKEILCMDIAPPPPNAESTPLPVEGLLTNRERVDAQTAEPGCAQCHHELINPTGFALEAFDAIGAIQTMENGIPIDSSATVFLGDGTADVAGPVEFMSAIAEAHMAQLCYARHWVQFAYERSLTNEDSCTAENLSSRIAEGGYTILDLIADLTQSDQFRTRAAGPAEASL